MVRGPSELRAPSCPLPVILVALVLCLPSLQGPLVAEVHMCPMLQLRGEWRFSSPPT